VLGPFDSTRKLNNHTRWRTLKSEDEDGHRQRRIIMAKGLEVIDSGKLLHVKVTGKLEKEDYATFAPLTDRLIQEHGKLRILFQMEDFHGWTAGAAWEDIKYDFKHWSDIERLAFVGESQWQHGLAVFCKPFTSATIRYFDRSQLEQAREWVTAA